MNGFTQIMALFAALGSIAIMVWLFYRWAVSEAWRLAAECWTTASELHPEIATLPGLQLYTTLATRHRTASGTSQMRDFAAVAWSMLVLDTAVPELFENGSPDDVADRLAKWYTGTVADADRLLNRHQRCAARAFAANPHGLEADTRSWLASLGEPHRHTASCFDHRTTDEPLCGKTYHSAT